MKAFLQKTCIVICLFTISSCKKKQPAFENSPNHIITTNQAINLHKNYVKDKKRVAERNFNKMNNTKGFEDTKFAWLTLDDLKTYIAYIEAAQEHNPQVDISGVRIYFGAYGNSGTYKNQQTVFMIPTVNSVAKKNNDIMKHLPFYIVPDSPKNALKGKINIVKELIGKHEQKSISDFEKKRIDSKASFLYSLEFSNTFTKLRDNDEETSLAFNEFQMSPPPKENQ